MRRSTVLAVLVIAPALPARAQSALDGPVCPEDVAPFHAFCDWELRPDPEAWIALLAPAGNTLLGTPGADALAAGGEGDVVSGLGGNDVLSSGFNRTALIGDRGGDDLSTDVFAEAGTLHGIAAQLGGPGNDAHRASLGATGIPAESFETQNELLVDLGSGDDQLEGRVFLDAFDFGDGDIAVSNQVFGREGADTIDVAADAQNFEGNTLALNAVDGGPGDDDIRVRAVTEFDGNSTIADNRVSGGDGNDVVDALASNRPNEPISASNLLLGGRGHDTLRAVMFTDSNVDHSIGTNELEGGDGDDELDAIHLTDGENSLTDLVTQLDGGKGNDRLSAESTAWGESVITSHELSGGPGDDTLSLALDLAVFEEDFGDADAENALDGGPGRDRLEATVTRTCEEQGLDCDPVAHAVNRLDGGSGNDVLVAALGPDVSGGSFLTGGKGNDELRVSGGTQNELDGGSGKDALFPGDGDDRITGGTGRDTIHFDVSVDQGSDTLADFEVRRDALKLAGIEDRGRRGLADELDAISSFDDQGPGSDVVIDLASGTRIIFAGLGTGEVDSWAKLVPARDLSLWKPGRKKPPKRPAAEIRSRAALLTDPALLPRDH